MTPTIKYPESNIQSRELLKQAISFIGTYQLSANPLNYTVCYEYLSGNHPLLTEDINQAIRESSQLTNQKMEQWFYNFLSEYDLTSLKQSQTDLVEFIAALSEVTVLAERNVSQFGQTLQQTEKELDAPNGSLESIMAHLLASTKSTQASMELLRQQIQESRHEIAILQSRLEKVSEEALTDALTGLVNRKGLSKSIDAALLYSEEVKSYPSLLMVDIDHFKKINDTYGHLLGDRVIKVVGETLKRQIKGKDTAARYGGEEFSVLLPETELRDAVKLADKIRSCVENTRIKRVSDQQEIGRVTISIGVARYQPKEPIADFFERADSALYRSKNEGRNRVTFIDNNEKKLPQIE
jgi:diguanylate cyclase